MSNLPETIELDDVALEAGSGSLEARALTRFRRHVLDNREHMRDLLDAAEKNQTVFSPLGTQWSDTLTEICKNLGIPLVSVNEIWPVISSITGRESTGRFVPKLTGRDPDDAGRADAFNAAVRSVREGDDMEQTDSAAFRQGHVKRAGAVEITTDVWSNRTPKMKARSLFLENLMFDFGGTQVNYSDRRAMAYGRELTRWEFEEDFADHADLWPNIVDQGTTGDFDPRDAWTSSIESQAFLCRVATRTTFVVDFEWKERIEIYQLEIPGEAALIWQIPEEEGGFGQELPMDLENVERDDPDFFKKLSMAILSAPMLQQQQAQQAMQEGAEPPPPMPMIYRNLMSAKQLMLFKTAYIALAGVDFTAYYRLKPECVYYASMVGQKVLKVGKRKDNMWSIFPLVPYFDQQNGRSIPYGTVDLLRERQELMNLGLALYLHAMAHMPKAPFGVDLDKLSGTDELEAINTDIASGKRALGIRGGAKALFPVPQGRMPDGVEQFFDKAMGLVAGGAGQSQYGVGSAGNLARTASKLVNQQLEAMSSTLAEAGDSLRQHRRDTTRKIVSTIIATWTPDDLRRVAGKNAKYVDDDKSLWWRALEWDIVVGEESSTRDMAQAALDSMVDTGMWQWISQIAPEVIPQVAHPIWGAASDDLIKKIEDQEPGRMVAALAEAAGIDPASLQAFIDSGGQTAAAEGEPIA